MAKRVRQADDTNWHTAIETDCSAPEVLGLLGGEYTEESSYTIAVDMWSLGYLAHWLFALRYPVAKFDLPKCCRNMTALPLQALSGVGATIEALDFVANLLHLKPGSRMTAHETIAHDWLAIHPKRGETPFNRQAIYLRNLPFQMRAVELQSELLHGQHLLRDQLFQQYQYLQFQERELRARLKQQNLRQQTLLAKQRHATPVSPLPKNRYADLWDLVNDSRNNPGLAATNTSATVRPASSQPDFTDRASPAFNDLPVDTALLDLNNPETGPRAELPQPPAKQQVAEPSKPADEDEIDFDAIEAELAAQEAEEARLEDEYQRKRAAAKSKEAAAKGDKDEAEAFDRNLQRMERMAEELELAREQRRDAENTQNDESKRLFAELKGAGAPANAGFGDSPPKTSKIAQEVKRKRPTFKTSQRDRKAAQKANRNVNGIAATQVA